MKWICLLLPACVSMLIRYRRKGEQQSRESMFIEICCWGVWVLINNLLTIFTLLYVVGHDSLVVEVFDSFAFSMKYIGIAFVFAWVMPYVVEIIEKYISITFTVAERK